MRQLKILFISMLLTLSSCVSKRVNEASGICFSLDKLNQQKIYNDINSLPKNLDSVFRLDLSEQQLSKIPEVVLTLSNLQELNLSQNQISSLNGIENLNSLQVLNIGMNNFKSFPVEIAKLNKLKVLDIWWNNINTFPDEFYNNTEVEELDMTSMFEFDFETNLRKIHLLKNLRRLNLGNNQIPNLTIQFGKLHNLKEFGYIRQDNIDLKEICLNYRGAKS